MTSTRWFVSLALIALPAFAQPHTMFPPVRGTREMVGAANNLEVEAGFRMLEKGGNAVDAGVASALAASVTEQSRFGLGGEMPLLVKMAGKPVVAISGIGVAPKKATVDYYQHRKAEPWEEGGRMPPIPAQGIRSAITPGVLDGLLLALEKYGTMSFAQVAQPAIEDADGFPIPDEFAQFLGSPQFEQTLALWPDSHKFFYPTGRAPNRGDLVHMPSLANTLRELVAAEKKAHGNRAA